MKKYITKENIIILIIIILSVLLSSIFIFDKVLYDGVDTKYHMSRIIGIVNSWKAGEIPAYIHLDDTGYGYAMGFFYSNLFMILPCIIYMLSDDIFLAYKIFLVVCGFFTAISMYICTKKITKSKYSATISTVLYTTCGYRIITMVVKAFVGELLSFIFIPIIILGLYELIFNNEKKWWIFTLGFVGILNSNLVMTEIMIVVSAIMVICNIKTIIKNKTRLFGFIKATILALLISAIFWMPLLEQLYQTTFAMTDKMSLYNPVRYLLDFSDMFWGTIQYKNNYAAAYALGIIFIIIMLFRLKIKEKSTIIKFCDISILTGLILLLCMTNFFPWKYLETLGGMLQFPSRMEVVVTAFFSMACGIICTRFAHKSNKLKIIILAIILIWQSVFCIICLQSCINALKDAYDVENRLKIGIEDDFEYNICDGVYLPSGANYKDAQFDSRNEINKKIITNNEDMEIKYTKTNLSVEIIFDNNTQEDTYIELPMYYYYGYTAESIIDTINYKIEKGENGKIRVYLDNKENDTIKIYYKNTNLQKISIIITMVTTILIIIYLLLNRFILKKSKILNKK